MSATSNTSWADMSSDEETNESYIESLNKIHDEVKALIPNMTNKNKKLSITLYEKILNQLKNEEEELPVVSLSGNSGSVKPENNIQDNAIDERTFNRTNERIGEDVEDYDKLFMDLFTSMQELIPVNQQSKEINRFKLESFNPSTKFKGVMNQFNFTESQIVNSQTISGETELNFNQRKYCMILLQLNFQIKYKKFNVDIDFQDLITNLLKINYITIEDNTASLNDNCKKHLIKLTQIIKSCYDKSQEKIPCHFFLQGKCKFNCNHGKFVHDINQSNTINNESNRSNGRGSPTF